MYFTYNMEYIRYINMNIYFYLYFRFKYKTKRFSCMKCNFPMRNCV